MSQEVVYYSLPYRNTKAREAVQSNATRLVLSAYEGSKLSQPARVRPLYYYDLQSNASGSSLYTNNNQITLTADASNPSGFAYTGTMTVLVPTNKVFIFYGLADLSPEPVLDAWQLKIQDKSYPILYMSPDINVDQDASYIYPAPFRAIPPQTTFTLTFYGSAAGPDNIDMLGFVAELGTAPGE